ncbi:MAG: hypothetical protein IJB10_03550 [Clostridia bacterium]|nr:hypothetical protein [Clostridia bacterium]
MVDYKVCSIVGDNDVYPDDKMCREVNLLLNKLINEKHFNVFYITPIGPFEWMVRKLLHDLKKNRYPFIVTYLLEPYDEFRPIGTGVGRLAYDTEELIRVKDPHPFRRPDEIQCKCTAIDNSEYVIFGLGNKELKEKYIEYATKLNKKYSLF